jgi:hypothetical protein
MLATGILKVYLADDVVLTVLLLFDAVMHDFYGFEVDDARKISSRILCGAS